MHAAPLRERTQGRWSAILPLIGLDQRFLTGKNGPCPWCEGKDRWRFINRDGSGNWICNQCGKGDGLALAVRVVGADFAIAAKRIEAVLGEVAVEKPRKEVSRDEMKRLWEGSQPLKGTPGERYFRRRGLDSVPSCLRYTTKDDEGACILARVSGPTGETVNLHRTFIDYAGMKLPIERPKRMMPHKTPVGCAVRLCPVSPRMGVAEGIENALSAWLLKGVPCWATTGTSFLEGFVIPAGVEELVIFGDNDKNFAGQRAAYARANRAVEVDKLKVVRVELPPIAGKDWNDMLRDYSEPTA